MTDDATSATIDPNARISSHGFTADVARLLELMAHSVYSERDVFLRELVSNAADACEKLRYEALSNEALAAKAGAPLVTIALDKDKRLLTVSDNGVGMGATNWSRRSEPSPIPARAPFSTKSAAAKIRKAWAKG